MSVKELIETAKPLYDESGRRYGVFISNQEWEELIALLTVDIDETAHLNSSEANRAYLLRAIADVEAGTELVSVNMNEYQ